jgi:hypothetical protein
MARSTRDVEQTALFGFANRARGATGGSTGTGGAAGSSGGGASGGAGGADAAAGAVLSGGFATVLSCNGTLTVFLGVRPPQAAGSDVIRWTAGTGGPVGDQLWTYDPATRLLVNQVNQLPLRKRANATFEAGPSATDGSPLTLRKNADGTYSFVLDEGRMIGIVTNNCQGALFSAVPAGSSGYQTTFTYYPSSLP